MRARACTHTQACTHSHTRKCARVDTAKGYAQQNNTHEYEYMRAHIHKQHACIMPYVTRVKRTKHHAANKRTETSADARLPALHDESCPVQLPPPPRLRFGGIRSIHVRAQHEERSKHALEDKLAVSVTTNKQRSDLRVQHLGTSLAG